MNTFPEIDARIDALEKELLSLRRRRNALTPLCRLPAELKVHIFQHVQYHRVTLPSSTNELDDPLGDIFSQQRNDEDSSWMKLMFTCVSLREAALEAGHLWRYIQIPGRVQWRDLCLQRAKGCPPILRHISPDEQGGPDDTLELAATHFSRATEAYLTFKISSENSVQNPQLEHYIYSASLNLAYLDLSSTRMALTNRILGGESLKLTTLVMSIERMDSYPELPNLMNFKLEWAYPKFDLGSSGYTSQLNKVITWLGLTPKLENLSFTWSDWRDISANDALQSGLQLPSLRTLSLFTPACLGAALLRALPEPSFGLDVWLDHSSDQTNDLLRTAFETAIHFWASLQADSELARKTRPLSSVLYYRRTRRDPLLSLRSLPRIGRVNTSQPFCRITAPNPDGLMDLQPVRTLHLVGGRTGPASENRLDIISYINGLDVDLLIVEEANMELHIKAIGRWLRQRKTDGRPVSTIQIRNPETEKARGSLAKLAASLIKRKVIGTVEWV